MEERGDQRVQVYRTAAEYLSTINLSTGPQWSYTLKTFARPTGRATRVIYTEYALPRETISPHDVIVDADGIVWYSSFGEQNLGRLDPRSGKVTIPFTPHFDQKPSCRITKGKGYVLATSHEWVEVHGKVGAVLEVTCE